MIVISTWGIGFTCTSATGSFLPKTIVAVVLVETLLCLGSSVSTPACTSVSSRSFNAQQLTVGWLMLRWKIQYLGSSVIPTWSGRGGGSTDDRQITLVSAN